MQIVLSGSFGALHCDFLETVSPCDLLVPIGPLTELSRLATQNSGDRAQGKLLLEWDSIGVSIQNLSSPFQSLALPASLDLFGGHLEPSTWQVITVSPTRMTPMLWQSLRTCIDAALSANPNPSRNPDKVMNAQVIYATSLRIAR
ncbi:hypothetical protein [Alloalcanivorax xenomutans]|uniref:hypothetical protein n=1 Tax=Alloalcanivorax xenomutans TaxID=1094342 RepID=UPI003BAACA2A